MRLLLPAARTIAVTLFDAIAVVRVDARQSVLPGLDVSQPHESPDCHLVTDSPSRAAAPFSTQAPEPARAAMT